MKHMLGLWASVVCLLAGASHMIKKLSHWVGHQRTGCCIFVQVTIGTAERGLEFSELTAFPADKLLADPENVTYDALQLRKGVVETFFNIEVGALS